MIGYHSNSWASCWRYLGIFRKRWKSTSRPNIQTFFHLPVIKWGGFHSGWKEPFLIFRFCLIGQKLIIRLSRRFVLASFVLEEVLYSRWSFGKIANFWGSKCELVFIGEPNEANVTDQVLFSATVLSRQRQSLVHRPLSDWQASTQSDAYENTSVAYFWS